MELEKIGSLLRESRESIGLSRAALAKRIHVSRGYISLVEKGGARPSGKFTTPSQDVLTRWTKALGWDDQFTEELLELAGHREQTRRPLRMPPATGALRFPQPRSLQLAQVLRELSEVAEELSHKDDDTGLVTDMLRDLKVTMEEMLSTNRIKSVEDLLSMLRTFLQWLRYYARSTENEGS